MINIFKKKKKVSKKKTDNNGNYRKKALERRVKEFLTGQDFADYIVYLKSSRKIMFSNFLAGIFRGLGFIVGMTIVFAILVWFLAAIVDFPVVGQYAKEAQIQLTKYAEETKYKGNFENIEKLLEQTNINIEKLLEEKNIVDSEILNEE